MLRETEADLERQLLGSSGSSSPRKENGSGGGGVWNQIRTDPSTLNQFFDDSQVRDEKTARKNAQVSLQPPLNFPLVLAAQPSEKGTYFFFTLICTSEI